ncbi:MAG: UDP-3-O-(3-hydroxymyristoyl)glucosamine N-acyltransferase [Henriciella sp.]
MTIDVRFFDYLGQKKLSELIELTGAEPISAADVNIISIAASDVAGPSDICFIEGNEKATRAVSEQAAACFVSAKMAGHLPDGVVPVIVKQPRWAFVQASRALYRVRDWSVGKAAYSVHETAILAPGVIIGDGAAIGERVRIGPNTVIGPGVQIGRDTTIGANTSIFCALIGDHVTILSGARIGESGFGVTLGPDGAEDIPQLGRVILQDHVTIGSNTCIDRGALSDTIIGERTKIDNLCQIAHNCVLGRNVMMASFGGISGSVTVGDGVMMGGRVGIADHVKIGDGARLAASAGVFRDIGAGEAWGGTPAKPLRQHLREVAWLDRQVAARRSDKK